MGPRGPSLASKYRKPALAKTLKDIRFFNVFWVQGLQDSLGRPRRAPKPQKMDPKINPIFNICLTNSGTILGTILGGQKVLNTCTKNGTSFGPPLLRVSGVGMLPKRKINETCRKGKAAGLIPRKRKRDKALALAYVGLARALPWPLEYVPMKPNVGHLGIVRKRYFGRWALPLRAL